MAVVKIIPKIHYSFASVHEIDQKCFFPVVYKYYKKRHNGKNLTGWCDDSYIDAERQSD